MDSPTTRLSLLSRVRDVADAEAWGEFEQRYSNLVLRYGLARGLQFADAEDVRQLVFLRLAQYLRRFDYAPQRGRFRSYLGAIVRNVISSLAGCPARRPQAVDDAEGWLQGLPDPRAEEPDECWEQEWVHHHCRLALDGVRRELDPRSVDVFEELLAGADAAAVASRRGLTLGAVVKIRQRVRARMQELIRKQLRDEEST